MNEAYKRPEVTKEEEITTDSFKQETMLMRQDKEWATAEQLIACVDNHAFKVARRMFTSTEGDRRDDLAAQRGDICLALMPKLGDIIQEAESADWGDFNTKAQMMQIVGAAMSTGKADAALAMELMKSINASSLK